MTSQGQSMFWDKKTMEGQTSIFLGTQAVDGVNMNSCSINGTCSCSEVAHNCTNWAVVDPNTQQMVCALSEGTLTIWLYYDSNNQIIVHEEEFDDMSGSMKEREILKYVSYNTVKIQSC
eukprot:TRINITY_DN1029_c0_g1_i2.p1 TRINITY_DN1029_c0_g1~~TRINITY_DN1029_c0_g1_i2.p1  ORF type:complete len:119 (-),score=14.49 TRINITY_DN1029_c0_g1_i2:177-533(-)